MSNCNAVFRLLPNNAHCSPYRQKEKPVKKEQHQKYRLIVGRLTYLSACKRPDTTFSVSFSARSLHASSMRHLGRAKKYVSTYPGP